MIPRLTLTILLLAASSSLYSAEQKPNILFILADDLGWADTTLYGHTSLYETPNLERLATRGMTFNRAYTASPLCSPTRSSILTGLHPARTGLTTPNCHKPEIVLQSIAAEKAPSDKKLTQLTNVTRLDTKYETLAERFKAEGYTTAHFGKWHLGSEPYSPLEHGFDTDSPHHPGPGPAGSYVAPWKFKDFDEAYPGEHIEDRMGDEIVTFLEEHQDEPFFLNYWQFSVHGPFNAKQEYIDRHRDRIDPDDEQRSPTYAAMMQSLDENVGKVLDAVDRLGLTDNTIIIFSSDNGGNMYNEVDGTTPTANRPLRGGKGNNWDGGTRVPGIVIWPGQIEAGSRSDELITSTDFYPTLLDMLDLSPSPNQSFDGISITPALKGEALDRDAIFTYFPHSTGVPDTLPPSVAIYQGDWKLFRFFHDGPDGNHRHELYNLIEDIGESNDVATQHPERVAALSAKLDSFETTTGAVTPRYNPAYLPTNPLLTELGFKVGKDTQLSIKEGKLILKALDQNAQTSLTLKDPAEPGDLELKLTFTSSAKGRIDLRWSEKGVTPLYFNTRLIHSKPYPASTETSVSLPLSARASVISFRIDFMQSAGTVRIEQIELLRKGKSEQNWKFTD